MQKILDLCLILYSKWEINFLSQILKTHANFKIPIFITSFRNSFSAITKEAFHKRKQKCARSWLSESVVAALVYTAQACPAIKRDMSEDRWLLI